MVAMLGAAVLSSPAPAPPADRLDPTEAKLKASYLLNFIRFTEWPADAFEAKDASLVIGLIGDDPMHEFIDRMMRGRRVHGRSVRVKRIRVEGTRVAAVEGSPGFATRLRSCHVVVVPADLPRVCRQVPSLVRGAPVLTVGEDRAFIDCGGMLSIIRRSNRVAFVANAEVIRRSPISVSSKLLRLAASLSR